MLRLHWKKWTTCKKEHMGNGREKMETLIRNKKEMSEIKNTVTEVKNDFGGHTGHN